METPAPAPAKKAAKKKTPAVKKKKAPAVKKVKAPTKKQLKAAERKRIKEENKILLAHKGRSVNFMADEDILLVKAYVNCSQNSAVGNDQSSKHFWAAVGSRFRDLYLEQDCRVVGLHRDNEACQNRWMRMIHPHTQKYNKYWRDLVESKPSGWVHEDLVKAAEAMYAEHEGKPFIFSACIPILHKMPKYTPMIKEAVDTEGGVETVNAMGTAMGSHLARPLGAKATKKKIKDDASKVSLDSSKVKSVSALSGSTDRLAFALESKSKIDGLNKMAQIYLKMGKMDEAMKCLADVADLVAAKSAPFAIDRADTPLTTSIGPSVAVAGLPDIAMDMASMVLNDPCKLTTDMVLQQNNLVDLQEQALAAQRAAKELVGVAAAEVIDMSDGALAKVAAKVANEGVDEEEDDLVSTTSSGHVHSPAEIANHIADQKAWEDAGGDNYDYDKAPHEQDSFVDTAGV